MAVKEIFGGINFGGIVGGWQPVLMPASKLPQDLASGWVEAMDGYVGADINPVYVLGTQLVNGYNYAIIADITLVTNPPVKKTGIVIVNVPFNGPVRDGKGSKIVRIITADEPEITPEVQVLFDKAKEGLLGISHKPLALIGNSITHGLLYFIVCESTPVRPGAAPYATLAKLWVKPDGTTEVTFDRIPKR